jgi:Ca2+-binding EF-hand superfamily protein
MLNINGQGGFNPTEFREFLKTLDVPLPSEMYFQQLFQRTDTEKDGRISFEELKNMMLKQLYNELNLNRYYVAVSLEEAECIRGIMHAQIQAGLPLLPNSSLALGLRILNGNMLLDGSAGLVSPPALQESTAVQCFRFINSELYYTKQDTSVLLHALHFNTPDQRQTFFNEVRSCRRRVQKDWKETLVEPVLSTIDEYQWLEFHAMITGIRTRIHKRGMRYLDAFRAFDYGRDGLLSCSEFYGGLEWLGLKVTPNDVYRLVKYIDKHKDNRIRFVDFEAALSAGEDESVEEPDPMSEVDFKQIAILPKSILVIPVF